MKRRAIASLALALAVVLVVAGCTTTGGGGGGTTSGGGGATQTVPLEGTFGIIRDWSESTHSIPVSFAAEESGCVLCHDARGFSMNTSDVASVNATAPFGPYVVATDCRACHTGYGVTLIQSGKVSTPTSPTVNAGVGALCLGCHRERGKPNVANNPQAPHPSVQGAVYLGYGGFRRPGVTYKSTVRHTQVKDMCVGCHMKDNKEGVPTHTFLPTSPQAVCGGCHEGTTDFNRKANADYDGNGSVQGIQDEVTGLLAVVANAAAQKAGADRVVQEEGRIVFFSGNTTVTAPIPNDAYQAAYNWALVTNDKSLGVHNPAYTVQLLQQSYLWLTGNPVPNAKPYPGTSFGATGTTGAPGTTGATGTTGGGGATGGATGTPSTTGGAGATGTP